MLSNYPSSNMLFISKLKLYTTKHYPYPPSPEVPLTPTLVVQDSEVGEGCLTAIGNKGS